MDYQPMNQVIDQGSSNKTETWYIAGAIVVIAVLALWYFYERQAPTAGTQPTAVEQAQTPSLSSGNTTADISADLNQSPDDSAALNQAEAASAQDVSGF